MQHTVGIGNKNWVRQVRHTKIDLYEYRGKIIYNFWREVFQNTKFEGEIYVNQFKIGVGTRKIDT